MQKKIGGLSVQHPPPIMSNKKRRKEQSGRGKTSPTHDKKLRDVSLNEKKKRNMITSLGGGPFLVPKTIHRGKDVGGRVMLVHVPK